MHSLSPLKMLRTSGVLATAALLIGGLTACTTQGHAVSEYTPPTMAPEQSIDQACDIAGNEVDRITLETEASIRAGIDQAADDLKAGKTPSFEFFSGSIDDTLAEVQDEVSNQEVAAALLDVRRALQNLGQSPKPENLLGAPAYLSALGGELNELASAGRQLQSLCGVTQP